MINPFDRERDESFFSAGLTFPLSEKLNLGFLYEDFSGWTFAYSEGLNAGFGYGGSRVKLRRFGILIEYEFEIVENKVNFSPLLTISKEINLLQQSEGRQIANIFDGSNNLNEYVGITEIEVYQGGQIIPTLGFSLKFKVFKGLSVFGTLKWSIGNRVFQEMFVNYSFLGETQPTAHFSNKGSGFIQLVGFSYDLNIMKPILR